MTTTTITQNPSPTSTTGAPNRRLRRGALGIALALAILAAPWPLPGSAAPDGAVAPTSDAVAAPEVAARHVGRRGRAVGGRRSQG